MHDDHQPEDPELVALRQMKGSRPTTWMVDRMLAYETMYIRNEPKFIRNAQIGLVVKGIALFAGVGLATQGAGEWWGMVGLLMLTLLASLGVTAQLFRARSYRRGYTDRGWVDTDVHKEVCGDPVAAVTFEYRMLRLTSETMRWS